MEDMTGELLQTADRLRAFHAKFKAADFTAALDGMWERAGELGKSASGSWLGYQANVYFKDFALPPPGRHFNIEYGLGHPLARGDTGWREYDRAAVMERLLGQDGKAALKSAEAMAEEGETLFNRCKADALSILNVYVAERPDSYVQRIAEEIDKMVVLDLAQIVNEMSPKGSVLTSDTKAAQQGNRAPPHANMRAAVNAVHQPAAHCFAMADKLEMVATHMRRAGRAAVRDARVGTNVFIGHGRSRVWMDLRDFVRDRLRLPFDEFNRVPVAGITNIARLSEMLDAAAVAFVVMTAEDEQADGSVQARMNVIHEVGLFQGRLGFTRAIVLLEEGCEEFSNIQGLGQIRFPKGNIGAKFEDIRLVLEREHLVPPP